MKKKIISVIVVISLMTVFMPVISRAAVFPYFMAVNDTLLPFNDDTMPFISGGEIFVPSRMFSGAGVWTADSEDLEWVRLYRGSKFVDFLTGRGVTQDQEGNNLQWSPARRIGSRFYVPLAPVCEFFGLSYEIIEVSREIIPQEQMRVIRIKSETGVNGLTFVGLNRNAIRAAYNEYYAPPQLPPVAAPVSPGVTEPQAPVEELPPDYSDVSIYISFYDISAGGADVLFELLDANAGSDYQFCFFVSADDIRENPGLIRRLYGSGHMIGIWLEKGTFEEYKAVSALLFEATKIKTVLISADASAEGALSVAGAHGLVSWKTSGSLLYDDTLSVEEVINMVEKESGARQNLMSSCSVNTALILSGILSFLRDNRYAVKGITETTEPA